MSCPVCFAPSDPVVTDSLNAGIFVLLGVTAVVIGGFIRFIASIARRSRLASNEDAPYAIEKPA